MSNKNALHALAASRLTAIGLFIAAFTLRLAAIGRYVTPDELAWVYRSLRMRDALLSFDWANTIQTGHPGVITTWLGAIGIQLTLWFDSASHVDLTWLQRLAWFTPTFGEPMQRLAVFLAGGRIMVALVTSMGVVIAWRLLTRRFHPLTALLAGVVLAFDPFSNGLSGLLHTDGLLTIIILLALLVALAPHTEMPPRRSAVLAGMLSAAALLSKLPGGLLLGFIPLLWFYQMRSDKQWGAWLLRCVVFGGAALITLGILLPALWGAPAHALEVITSTSSKTAANARPDFWFGRRTNAPFYLFYPIVFFFRQSPAVTLALFLLLINRSWKTQAEQLTRSRFYLRTLALFALLFMCGLSISTRVFDRYGLPLFVLLTLAIVLYFGQWLQTQPQQTRQRLHTATVGIAILFGMVNAAWPLMAYNWWTGGQTIAQRILPVGWGEAEGMAARWVAEQTARSDGEWPILYTWAVPSVAPFYEGQVVHINPTSLGDWRDSDYLIAPTYDRSLLSATPGSRIDPAYIRYYFPPLYRAEAGPSTAGIFTGLDINLLAVDRLSTTAQNVQFGETIALRSAGVQMSTISNDLLVRTQWEKLAGGNANVQIAVVDDQRHTWYRLEEQIVNRSGFPVALWDTERPQTIDYSLPLPPDLPPGDYTVTLQLFDASGARQGVFADNQRFVGVEQPIDAFTWKQPVPQPPSELPNRVSAENLRAHQPPPATVGTGERLTLDIWWQKSADQSPTLALQLDDITLNTSVDLSAVPQDNLVHLRPTWLIPADFEPGQYALTLDGITLGNVTIQLRERNFTLPENLDSFGIQFVPVANLEQVEIQLIDGELSIVLLWQAMEPDNVAYSTFIHVRDAAGNIITQADRSPVEPTSGWLPNQVVSDQFTFSNVDEAATVAIGLYDPTSGVRLPVFDLEGNELPNQQVMVELP